MQDKSAQYSAFVRRFEILKAKKLLNEEETAVLLGYSRSWVQKLKRGEINLDKEKPWIRLEQAEEEAGIRIPKSPTIEQIESRVPSESVRFEAYINILGELHDLALLRFPNDLDRGAAEFDRLCGLLAAAIGKAVVGQAVKEIGGYKPGGSVSEEEKRATAG